MNPCPADPRRGYPPRPVVDECSAAVLDEAVLSLSLLRCPRLSRGPSSTTGNGHSGPVAYDVPAVLRTARLAAIWPVMVLPQTRLTRSSQLRKPSPEASGRAP